MALTRKVNGKEYEVLRFPMQNLKISQGVNGEFSHIGVPALDLCGKDAGIEETLAPCTMKLVAWDTPANGNTVFFQSVNPVLFADGTIDYATMMFIHDNDITDILNYFYAGGVWPQYMPFGDEGTAGYATGNHTHVEIARGKFSKCYVKNIFGTWQLPNSIRPDLAFVIDGCTVYYNGQPLGSGDKMDWKTSNEIPGVDKVVVSATSLPSGAASNTTTQTEEQEKTKSKSGWVKVDDRWQYINSAGNQVKSDWIQDNGAWYYIKANGYAAQYEWVNILYKGQKEWFYFNKKAQMLSATWFEVDSIWYYVHKNGTLARTAWIPYDGNWYYVNAKGEMIKNETLVIDNVEHTFDSKGRWIKPKKEEEAEEPEEIGEYAQDPIPKVPTYGCDISWHNGEDFPVEEYDFVIIRACWGTNIDTLFEDNVKRCEEHGVPWGAYCYSYALNAEDAAEEADYFVDLMADKKPDLGLWLDYEDADGYKKKHDALTRENSQAICETFMNRMKERTDLYCGIYCNPNYLKNYVDNNGKWAQWLAWWNVETDKQDQCVIHQYKVENGIDLDVSYIPLDEFKNKNE